MRVRVTLPTKDGKRLKEQLVGSAEKVEEETAGQDEYEVVSWGKLVISGDRWAYARLQILLIDPGQFKVLNELLQKEVKGRGRIETLTFAAVAGEN
jgi:ribosome maturation protein SDO1